MISSCLLKVKVHCVADASCARLEALLLHLTTLICFLELLHEQILKQVILCLCRRVNHAHMLTDGYVPCRISDLCDPIALSSAIRAEK